MLKKLSVVVLSLALCLGAAGCKKKLTAAQAKAAQETKLKDEKKGKAAKYLKELAEKYPDSEFAPKARERLQSIGPVATPAPKK